MRALLAILLVTGGCTRENGAYCDAAKPCALGAACNLATNACEPIPGFDMGVGDLGDTDQGADLSQSCAVACIGAAPICISPDCKACDTVGDGELACSTLTMGTPHCQTTGPSQGACVQCRTAADCTTPACDPADHVCRACVTDDDCASKVCDLIYGSPTQYQCVQNVIYVDCMAGNGAADGKTLATAVDKISTGIMRAMTNSYDTIRVIGSCNQENLTINNTNITLVGGAGAEIRWNNGNNPALQVQGSSQVVVRHFTISGATGGNNADGILCTAMNGSVTVLDCVITNNLQYGIDGNNCGRVNVERSYIGGSSTSQPNFTGGIRVGKAFHIIDSFIVNNGNGTGPSAGGISITSPSNAAILDLTNNTIADNTGSGANAGVSCMNNVTIKNNILYNNKIAGAAASETDCTLVYCASDDPRDALNPTGVNLAATPPAFVGTDNYHLQATSPCIDKGTNMGIPAHDYDKQLRIDLKTGKADIGADEVQ